MLRLMMCSVAEQRVHLVGEGPVSISGDCGKANPIAGALVTSAGRRSLRSITRNQCDQGGI